MDEGLRKIAEVAATVLAVAAVLGFSAWNSSSRRPTASAWIIALGLVLLGIVLLAADGHKRWLYVLTVAPPVMVLQHAVWLHVVRRNALVDVSMGTSQTEEPPSAKPKASERKTVDGQWLDGLLLRYGVLLLLLWGAMFVQANALLNLEGGGSWIGMLGRAVGIGDKYGTWIIAPGLLGLLGAYVQIITRLAYRVGTHDLTPGAVTDALRTVCVGPALAIGCALIIGPAPLASPPTRMIADAPVYFIAGFSPSLVIEAIRALGERLFQITRAKPVMPYPDLTSLPGFDENAVARFAEANIGDVWLLSTMDLGRLVRSTSYDPMQLARWIDLALLIVALPSHWTKVVDVGISGATQLCDATTASTWDRTRKLMETEADHVEAAARVLSGRSEVQILKAYFERAVRRSIGAVQDRPAAAMPTPAEPVLASPPVAPSFDASV